MVTIRLARGGSKKHPFYHIVVKDSRQSRDGRYIERLGYYNPMPAGNDIALKIDDERTKYWISQGAKPSQEVENLIKRSKKMVIPDKNINKVEPEAA